LGNFRRRIRDGAARVGQRDGAAAAVAGVRAGGDEATHPEPVDHALGRGRIEVN
jgi:hypothetical protein